jgi:hypothetical protein
MKVLKVSMGRNNRYNIGGYESIGPEIVVEVTPSPSETVQEACQSAKALMDKLYNMALVREMEEAKARQKEKGSITAELKALHFWWTSTQSKGRR